YERIDRHVTREISIEHRSEQECAGALECQFIDVHGDLEPAAKGEWPRLEQAAHHASDAHRPDALDLPPSADVSARRVQVEQIPQRRGASLPARLRERQTIEREMTDG